MIQKELKQLIDKYCMGVVPTDAQQDEIFDMVKELGADPKEVADYMQKMQNGPTREEVEAKKKMLEEKRKKEELAAKQKAENLAKQKAEEEEREKAKIEATRMVELDTENFDNESSLKTWFTIFLIASLIGLFFIFKNNDSNDSVKSENTSAFSSNESLLDEVSVSEVTTDEVVTSSDYDDDDDTSIENKLRKKYDYVYGLNSDNLYRVEKNDKKGLCNASGVEVVPPVYDYIYSVDDGVIKVEKGDKKGLIDANTFKVLLPCEYTYIYSKNGRTIKVEKGDKKGLIDANTYEVLVPCEYSYFYSESNGLIKVEKGDKKGFLNARTYKLVTPCIYDYIYPPDGGLIKVEKNGKTGYLNLDGSVARRPQ